MLLRETDERPAGFGLDVGRVDDGQQAARQSLGAEVVEDVDGSMVADWSFSSSLTRPRQKSELRTSVARK